MDRWQGKVAIVTGASSGIGEETCKQLVEKGMIVVGLARREDKLRELENQLKEKQGKFYYVKVDLCSEENILEAFAWVKKTLKSVDVLINNAGVLKLTDSLGKTNDWKLLFDTNVIGLNICCREAINIMKELKINGHVVNVNSITGHQIINNFPKIDIYGATKNTVTTLTEYLRILMSREKLPIRVTSVSPGLVLTDMAAQFDLKITNENSILKPIDIADAILYALSAPQRVNVCINCTLKM
ncbi:Hypothetical protein CINCED_3A010977 [Cinara cedri]|uniref:Farnesol dehydrogenase-like n=1 Tax=Cinara cedri TaxID=506608 RepID=A0A5E4M5Y1_9HEMI|nr:Hypothetical protein CINCED_3A010977 [Cinara cedri]